jgi:hypothetical protein
MISGVAPTTTRVAELFVISERVLVEVLGRIRPGQGKIVLPPMRVDDPPRSIRDSVARHARDEARLAGLGNSGAELGEEPQAAVVRLAAAACAAAEAGTIADEDLLLATITRCFLAHDVAFHLGSSACPLPEDLARGLWEITEPDAQKWRDAGVFAEPLTPYPPDVSWRDRFLRSAGRDPHPHFD